jgi:hypothetical protein
MERLVDSNSVPSAAYADSELVLPIGLPSEDQSALEPAPRMILGTSFIVILLFSLGLWVGIWAAVNSLLSPLL